MTKDEKRTDVVNFITEVLRTAGEDVVATASNKIAFPFTFGEGEEAFVQITVSIRKGSRDGEAFDGFAEAKDFEFRKAEKVKAKAKADMKKTAKK